jgi:DNA-binding protein Fis
MAGCGCKNKPVQPTPSTPANQSQPNTQNSQSNTIQESIKKVVEKYYQKK